MESTITFNYNQLQPASPQYNMAQSTPHKPKAPANINLLNGLDLDHNLLYEKRNHKKLTQISQLHDKLTSKQLNLNTIKSLNQKTTQKPAKNAKTQSEPQQEAKINEKSSQSNPEKKDSIGNQEQKNTRESQNKINGYQTLNQQQNQLNQGFKIQKFKKIKKTRRRRKRRSRYNWKTISEQKQLSLTYGFPFLNNYVQNHSEEYLKTMQAIDKMRENFANPDQSTYINCDVKYFNWQLFTQQVGKFDVLIIDPPWRIKGAQQNDSQFMFSNCKFSLDYNTMSNSEIEQLPLQLISDEGYIFLWILNTQLDSSLQVMQKWGYQLIDELIWVKLRDQKIYLTHGYYFMHSYQICLIGYKSKNGKKSEKNLFSKQLQKKSNEMEIEDQLNQSKIHESQQNISVKRQSKKNQVQIFHDKQKNKPRVNINSNVVFGSVNLKSQKPQDVYYMIQLMFKGHRKIEIFARNHNRRFGIFSIGNQLGQSYQKWMQTSQCDKCQKAILVGTKRFKSKKKTNYDLCEQCVQKDEQKNNYFLIRNQVDEDIRHQYISCNLCKTQPIWGNRFYCSTCHNFDLCQACYDKFMQIQDQQEKKKIHPGDHQIQVLEVPNFGNDFPIHQFKCYSCYQNPIVGICYTCTSCKNLNLCQKCFFERPRGDALFSSKNHKQNHQVEAIFQSQYRFDKKYECFSCKKGIYENCWMCQNCHNFYFCDDCYNNKDQFKSLYANAHKKYHIYIKIF